MSHSIQTSRLRAPSSKGSSLPLKATHITINSNEIYSLPTMHRNHLSEFTLAAHSSRPVCAPVLTYIKYAPLRCSPSHADYTTMPNSYQNHIRIAEPLASITARNGNKSKQP